MNILKKLITLIIIVGLVAGCSSSKKKWIGSYRGRDVNDSLEILVLTIYDDNSAKLISSGGETKGTWEEEDEERLKIILDDEYELKLLSKDNMNVEFNYYEDGRTISNMSKV